MISKEDFYVAIRPTYFEQITGGDDNIWQDAEAMASATLRDCLHTKYDVDTIFANIDNYKHVKRWVIVIAVYFMYERVPDSAVPDRVVKNYDDVMAMCARIAQGKQSADLPPATDDDDNIISTFRMGSVEQRTH